MAAGRGQGWGAGPYYAPQQKPMAPTESAPFSASSANAGSHAAFKKPG